MRLRESNQCLGRAPVMSGAAARRCRGWIAQRASSSHLTASSTSTSHRARDVHTTFAAASQQQWMKVPNDGWLLRDFLREALYNRDDGYFTQPSRNPVGVMSKPIPFHALLGQEDYARVLAGRYTQLASQWLTPVEIFRPHYANAIARYILAQHAYAQLDSDSDLTIYELGGGTGTCAANILAHIRDADPRVYARTKYVGVEISHQLAKLQRETVKRQLGADVNVVTDHTHTAGHTPNRDKSRTGKLYDAGVKATYSVERRDATDAKGWGAANDDSCFVVALEVLDNLPHDRVLPTDDPNHNCAMQTRVFARRRAEDNAVFGFEQRLEPMTDPLLRRACDAIDKGHQMEASVAKSFGKSFGKFSKKFIDRWLRGESDWDARFVPTGALSLLETLHHKRPGHRLIAADFDSLPNVRVPGINAPLVATQAPGGKSEDLGTYLDQVGGCDVFFPTDFDALASLDRSAREFNNSIELNNSIGDAGGKGAATPGNHGGELPRGHRDRACEVISTKEFMRRHADLDATVTGSGYNPLTQDFANTIFFLS